MDLLAQGALRRNGSFGEQPMNSAAKKQVGCANQQNVGRDAAMP